MFECEDSENPVVWSWVIHGMCEEGMMWWRERLTCFQEGETLGQDHQKKHKVGPLEDLRSKIENGGKVVVIDDNWGSNNWCVKRKSKRLDEAREKEFTNVKKKIQMEESLEVQISKKKLKS